MKRSKGMNLIALFVLLVLSYPVSPAIASIDRLSIASSARTQNEASCLAGAKASCSDVAGAAFLDCADSLGLTFDDLENGSSGVYTCAAWGGLAYLWCWITSIF